MNSEWLSLRGTNKVSDVALLDSILCIIQKQSLKEIGIFGNSIYIVTIYWQHLRIHYIACNLSFYPTIMPNRLKVENGSLLRGEESGVFSVNGIKSKLLSVGYSEAIFVTMRDGSYKEWTMMSIDLKEIAGPDSTVYKLGKWKDNRKNK